MNKIVRIAYVSALVVALAACGGAKDDKAKLNDMKAKLEKLKKQKGDLDADIHKLEDDISKADPNAVLVTKLVGVDTVGKSDFSHFVELQGKIDAENVVYVSPRGQGGMVKAVYVKAGDHVSKGQLLLKLDDAVQQQQVVAARQQISGVKARLAQAQSIYERQQNLWKENIGSQQQVLNAKADVDALQSQLNAAQAQVALASQTANLSNIYAEINGVVDAVDIKVGEFFQGPNPAAKTVGIRIVNNGSLKLVANVPDVYVGKIKKGDRVQVVVPGVDSVNSSISVAGTFIDPSTRSFNVEAKLPANPLFRANQTATLRVLDYQAKAAVTVPTNVVQSDEKGKYVYVAEKSGTKLLARRKTVQIGESFGNITEIKSGLSAGDVIITEGYQSVYDGQNLSTN